MNIIDKSIIKLLHQVDKFSHKGQNGKLLIIGGSELFHGASLWALKTASRIVDMVFYLSTDRNQEYANWLNKQLYDFINIRFEDLDDYIKEADTVLLGSGMVRERIKNYKSKIINQAVNISRDNFEDTKLVVETLLNRYPEKKWVLDAGALQMMETNCLKKLSQVIITPHIREMCQLFKLKIKSEKLKMTDENVKFWEEITEKKAGKYSCTILLKGSTDIICDSEKCALNKTGNEGMTKGGTGDVLAGLVAALACKNDCFTATAAGAFICGLSGDELYKKVGTFFNASDLCEQIPGTFHHLYK